MHQPKCCPNCQQELISNYGPCPFCGKKPKKHFSVNIGFLIIPVAGFLALMFVNPTDLQNIYDQVVDVFDLETSFEDGEVPMKYQEAVSLAQFYLTCSDYSKLELYEELTSKYGQNLSKKVAQYAVDHVQVDWKENALKTASYYSQKEFLSKQGIYDQLVSNQFTTEEIQYALEHLNVDWKENALNKAKRYSDNLHLSKLDIYEQLISNFGEEFTEEEAQYAIDNLQVDWKENALKWAEGMSDSQHLSKIALYQELIGEYGGKFTEDEAQYAMEHIDVDWKENARKFAQFLKDGMEMSNDEIYSYLLTAHSARFTEEEARYALQHLE